MTAPVAAPAPRRPRTRRRALTIVLPVAFAAAFIGLWYLTSAFLLSPSRRFILPMPHEVLVVAFLTPKNLLALLGPLGTSTLIAMLGLLIAAAIGIVTAVLMSQAKWVEITLFPYAVALQSIPILAIVPLIAFAIGYGFESRILVVVLISLFPIITNTLFGLQSTSPQMRDLFTLKRASRWTVLTKLQFPAALPAVFTGLRISAGMAVVGSIVADFFFRKGDSGIGLVIDTYRNQLNGEMLYGAILLASLLGLVAFWVFGLIGRLAVGSWYRPDAR
jgi:NitT/TauT family transport system permease protein